MCSPSPFLFFLKSSDLRIGLLPLSWRLCRRLLRGFGPQLLGFAISLHRLNVKAILEANLPAKVAGQHEELLEDRGGIPHILQGIVGGVFRRLRHSKVCAKVVE